MTELSPLDESAAAQPSSEWPLNGQPAVTDQLVRHALAPLEELPGTPVADHEEVYNALHDNLRAALDADPASEDPASEDPASEDPASEDPASEDPASEDPATADPDSSDPSGGGA